MMMRMRVMLSASVTTGKEWKKRSILLKRKLHTIRISLSFFPSEPCDIKEINEYL